MRLQRDMIFYVIFIVMMNLYESKSFLDVIICYLN